MVDEKKAILKLRTEMNKIIKETDKAGSDEAECINLLIDILEKYLKEEAEDEHDGCKKCKYECLEDDKEPCKGCKQNATDNYEPMTNADRIRQMSDAELAGWVIDITIDARRGNARTRVEWYEWLRKESEV